MSNTSATGGYLIPSSTAALPGGLTLDQFIQTLLVGISGLDGTLVRAKYQLNPPKQPGASVNWIAFRMTQENPDTYAYVGIDPSGIMNLQRHEDLKIQCSFYGPNSMDIMGYVRDGFQISQNLEALTSAKMAFTSTGQPLLVPDFVNERWIQRYEMEINLRRMVLRTYPILPLLVGPNGTLQTQLGNGNYTRNWQTPEES